VAFLLLGKSADQVDQHLIRFAVLLRKTRDDVAKIAFVELGVFADCAGLEKRGPAAPVTQTIVVAGSFSFEGA
jgi:hypothetical protein